MDEEEEAIYPIYVSYPTGTTVEEVFAGTDHSNIDANTDDLGGEDDDTQQENRQRRGGATAVAHDIQEAAGSFTANKFATIRAHSIYGIGYGSVRNDCSWK